MLREYTLNVLPMTTTKKMAIIWAEVLTNIIVVTVLQYIRLSNHHILDIKMAQCYMSVVSHGGGGGQLQGSRLTPYASHLWTHKKKPVRTKPSKICKGSAVAVLAAGFFSGWSCWGSLCRKGHWEPQELLLHGWQPFFLAPSCH